MGSELIVIDASRPCHLVCSRGFHRRRHHLLTYLADVYRLLPVDKGRKAVLVPFRLTSPNVFAMDAYELAYFGGRLCRLDV
jgi:hypothetical protein